MPIKIAISCVGSGIGQSILESCSLSVLPISILGLDCNPLAYGLYECNDFKIVPKIEDPNYVSILLDICATEEVDVFIPASDDELLLISANRTKFEDKGIKLILATHRALEFCRNKGMDPIYEELFSNLFVKSYSAESFEDHNLTFPLICKPKSGSGSVGIKIIRNSEELKLVDKDDILQEIALPLATDPNYSMYMDGLKKGMNLQLSELSIHFVFDKNSELIGKVSTYNSLKQGIPTEIVPYDNDQVWKEINPLIEFFKSLKMVGPLNIQGRLTDNGLKLFEMNARFTGISGLRAQMGFNEVEACVRDILGETPQKLEMNDSLFGLRQTANKTVSFSNAKLNNPFVRHKKKRVLITGINGYLGRAIAQEFSQDEKFEILGFVRDKQVAKMKHPTIGMFDMSDINKGKLSLGNIDVLLHLAFGRPFRGNDEIAESLEFTSRLFHLAAKHQVGRVINISSQSIYEKDPHIPSKEEDSPTPATVYAMAKYNSELILNTLYRDLIHCQFTSLRLSGLWGGSEGLVEIDLLSRFVNHIKNGENISLKNGNYMVYCLDVRDAANAIIKLLNEDDPIKEKVYNLGPTEGVRIKELAEKSIEIASEFNLNVGSKIMDDQDDFTQHHIIDSSKFYSAFNWKPRYTWEDSLRSVFNYLGI